MSKIEREKGKKERKKKKENNLAIKREVLSMKERKLRTAYK